MGATSGDAVEIIFGFIVVASTWRSWIALNTTKTIIVMAECAVNGVRRRLKEGEIPLQVKFDGKILEVWHQDTFSREKVKLNERSGELAYCKTSWGWVESCGSGFK